MLWLLLDTNVALSGLLWSGAPAFILDAARAGRVALFTSRELLDELKDVLARPQFEQRLRDHLLTPDIALARYQRLCHVVTPEPVVVFGLRDLDDTAVLGAAVGGAVHAIVTGDKDLLVLRQLQEIMIVMPSEAAARLRL